MRVLMAPVYDLGRDYVSEGDSQFWWSRLVVERLVEQGNFVYWMVPMDISVPELPRTKLLRFTVPQAWGSKGQFVLRHVFPDVLVNEFPGPVADRFVDFVMTNDAYFGLELQQMFSSRRIIYAVPIVLYDNYPTLIGWEEQEWVSLAPDKTEAESMLYSRALGYCLCETVGCSPFVSARTIETVSGYAPPALARRFLQRRKYVMNFVSTRWFDELILPQEKHPKFSCYFGGRFTATKQGEKSVEQYLKLLMGGRDIEIYVTAVGGGKRLSKVLRSYGAHDQVKYFWNLSIVEALKIAARCHVAVFYQLNPGAGAIYDWLYCGLVVLLKRHGFAEEEQQLPPGYPFWFNDDDECAAMLRWVYEHYEEAQSMLAKLEIQKWCREVGDEDLGTQHLISYGVQALEEIKAQEARQRYDDDTVNLVRKVFEAHGATTMGELIEMIDVVAGRKIMQKQWGGGIKGVLPMRIYRHLIPPGWKDDCEIDVPRFVKCEE